MFPDAKWLEALKLPLRPTLAIALASGVLLLLDLQGVLDLGPLKPFARPVFIIAAVVFGALSLVGLAEPLIAPIRERQHRSLLAARRAVRERQEVADRETAKSEVLARLDHLSKEEIHYVADCLRNGTPSFYTYVFSPPVTLMQGKLLVWTPGGQHHQDHYPFSFQDFVWNALLARKDEFIQKDEQHKRAEEAAKQAARRR